MVLDFSVEVTKAVSMDEEATVVADVPVLHNRTFIIKIKTTTPSRM